MKLAHIHNDKTALLIFFCGFYTDANCFLPFDNGAFDVLYVSDYSEIDFGIFDDFDFSPYCEINLIAYSYGVWAAGVLAAAKCLPPVDKSLAVCGTFKPIDDNYGVPVIIYDLMLKSLLSSSAGVVIETFKKRTYTGVDIHIKDADRQIDSLKEELENIKELAGKIESRFDFDCVIIGKNDKIIPPRAQRNFWQGHLSHRRVRELDTGHFPFAEFANFEEMLNA